MSHLDFRFVLARSLLTGGAIALVAGCAGKPIAEPPVTPSAEPTAVKEATPEPPKADPPTAPKTASKAGPGGFPLPPDAEKDAEKSAGPIEVFVVQRGKDTALEDLRKILDAEGWKIDSEQPSPSNASMRLTVSKGGDTFKVSVTGTDSQAAFIVTPPKKAP